MKALVSCLLLLGLVLGIVQGVSASASSNEPHWAEVVKDYYPYWKNHYWVDRELWGNRGYIIGGPPQRLSEDPGFGALEIETIVIKEQPLDTIARKLPDKPAFHVVKKGECLWYIAGYEDIYGDPLKWPIIYKANTDKIKNPDLIYPGQKLVIPRD